jgi:hypothetical protein
LTGHFLGTTSGKFSSHVRFPLLFHQHDLGTDAFGTGVYASEYDKWLARIGSNEVLRIAAVRSMLKQLSISFRRQVDDAQSKIESLVQHGINPRLEANEDIAAARELVDDITSLRRVVTAMYSPYAK